LFFTYQETHENQALLSVSRQQQTVSQSDFLEGSGLFTGEKCFLRLCPAPVNTGVLFKRIDLPKNKYIPATLDFVQATPRCTLLGDHEVRVQTVEHLLAALKAYEIDNVIVEISGSEIPILDGSSMLFVDLIEKCGIVEQDLPLHAKTLEQPVYFSQGDIHLIAIPSDEYRISYTLHYPNSSLLRAQFYSTVINPETFKREIAPCRTFALYEEIAPLVEKGLIKGGGLENALIIKDGAILNPEGARFPEEMARHKVLDLVGDLSLMGISFTAHIIAIRSGHASNVQFARKLLNQITMES
jgi:UDP-3-O-[3-hydroxymyristoyl] N-acetylglucosamine deacetylase